MREIKFRAWDKKKEIMFGIIELGMTFGKRGTKDIEFMQFTGLKDKNGKEIYEGDIVKCQYSCHPEYPFRESIMEVSWEEENCEFSWFLQKRYNNAIKDLKVIGNIYENPELLKPTDKKTKEKRE